MKSIRWGIALLACYIIMIASAFSWVAIYSHLLQPGLSMEHYHAYAEQTAPWVALIVGIPAFFGAGWWIARKAGANPWGTTTAMVLLPNIGFGVTRRALVKASRN